MAVNAAKAYQQAKMHTASKEDTVTMLYDGAIKFCNQAGTSLEKKDYEATNTYIKKAHRIIGELQLMLDKRYPVSEDFNNIYNYILDLLIMANVKKDSEFLERATEQIRGIRETWVEVVKQAKGK